MSTRQIVQFLRSRRLLVFVAAVMIVLIVVYSYSPTSHVSEFQGRPCKIHKLDPWDKTLSDYLKDPKPVQCTDDTFSLMYVDDHGVLQLNQSAISHYRMTSLQCVYQHINRKTNDKDILINDAVKFTPPVFVKNRVFRVICTTTDDNIVYDFVHLNMAWNSSDVRESKIGFEADDDLSIIYFGLDSASRSHALRKLPKSYKYLKETLGAYDFRGYMKVGLNSFPNIVPLLTGNEYTKYHMENILRVHLDRMPFIWKESLMQKYATLHAEDRPDISTMNYENSGFKQQPVDYYFRVFGLAMDQIEPTIIKPLGKSSWYCYGNKQHYLLQIDYLKRFVEKYTRRLKFAFMWNNQIGHEDFISLGRGDQPLFEFLQWMKNNDHLKNSILIVGSDHGFRLGGASTTYIGRLENNMPFLMVYVPEGLKKRYPHIHTNLVHNTEMLTSAFDVHETMMDVLKKDFSNTVSSEVSNTRTSRSLLKKIPETRTCVDAGIPDQYCTCYDATSVHIKHPIVIKVAKHVTENINFRLKQYKHLCKNLYLLNITEAKVMYTAQGDSDNAHIDRKPGFFKRLLGYDESDDSGRYILMFYTGPNNGLIEAMVDYEKHPARGHDNKMTIIGDPVRANKYGNQSHCIQDQVLRQYCLCNDIII